MRSRDPSYVAFQSPVVEAVSSSDPYIARAHAADYRATPPSDRGSQVDSAVGGFIFVLMYSLTLR